MVAQIEGQISIFDFLGELSALKEEKDFDPLYEFAKRGSGFAGGKSRILNFFADTMDKKERVKFLKSEYGIGGFGNPREDKNKYQLHTADYSMSIAKGKIKLSWYKPGVEKDFEAIYSFEQLHDSILECIHNGDY